MRTNTGVEEPASGDADRMTAMLTASQTTQATPLMATLEVVGLQTHEREPGSDEWDDAISRFARTVIDAVDGNARVYLLTPAPYSASARFTVRTEVVKGQDEETIETLVEALADHPTGVQVTDATLTR